MNESQQPGPETEKPGWFQLDVHPYVFFISAGVIVLFVVPAIFFEKNVDNLFNLVQGAISHYAGWFFAAAMNIVLIFVISLLLGRFGNIRLGGEGARPAFSTPAWFSPCCSAPAWA